MRFSVGGIEVGEKVKGVVIVKRGRRGRMVKGLLGCMEVLMRLGSGERKVFCVK